MKKDGGSRIKDTGQISASQNDSGSVVNIDFILAVCVFMLAFTVMLNYVSGLSMLLSTDTDDTYLTANRISGVVVCDPGYETSTSTAAWEDVWSTDPDAVARIGFTRDADNRNVLDVDKVDALMKNSTSSSDNVSWWDFGKYTNTDGEYQNARRALGVKKYDLYMQIHPVNDSVYDANLARTYAQGNITTMSSAAIVERVVAVQEYDIDQAIWNNLVDSNGDAVKYRLILWMW